MHDTAVGAVGAVGSWCTAAQLRDLAVNRLSGGGCKWVIIMMMMMPGARQLVYGSTRPGGGSFAAS